MRRKLAYCSYVLILVVGIGGSTTTSLAKPVTFHFQAEVIQNLGPALSPQFPIGRQVWGHYTFESTTPANSSSSNISATYRHAIQQFVVTIDGLGVGSGIGGDITVANPISTSGTSADISDSYIVVSPASGVSIPSVGQGPRNLTQATLRLRDIDQVALNSTALPTTPLDLRYFLDHLSSSSPTDNAELWLTFMSQSAVYTASLRVTSLTSVPEPTTAALLLPLVFLSLRRRATNT